MSDEGFLKRWSRRKRTETASPPADPESVERSPSQPSPAARGKEQDETVPPQSGGGLDGGDSTSEKREDEAIDPATLPPIESLGPESDYTVFLKKGVPDALRIAALRKAWMSDPFIRDFRGPAEYAIDYTTSEFDLRPTDDVAKMLDHIFPPAPVQAGPSAGPAAAPPTAVASERPIAPTESPALPQRKAEAEPPPIAKKETSPAVSQPATQPRKHGGALPD